MSKGTIFNIQKYSIHDGPGIRTTIFLKGCPLSCIWCHNPESQSFRAEVMCYDKRCIGCGECIKACRQGAVFIKDGSIQYDREMCTMCRKCTDACYAKAREAAGELVDTSYVMAQIEKDRVFYEESGGGVTFSGGEPLSQPEFLLSLLELCRKEEIHTAVDTCGYAPSDVIAAASKYTDLFLYDLKLINDEKHMKYTGVSNKLILENLNIISKLGKRIFVRIPLLPGINDDDENIRHTADIIRTTPGVEQVNILPYHSIAADKYSRLGRSHCLMDIKVPTADEVDITVQKFMSYGIKTKIGG